MDLLQNPFYILGATPRDNRRKIIELADERSLMTDSGECAKARSDLTNPRKRLSAEIAWLPGLGPKRVTEILALLDNSVNDLLGISQLTSVARANLLAAGLSRLTGTNDPEEIAKWILELAWAFENVKPENLCTIINEERVVSGFPEVTDISVVEAEIQERRIYYRQVIKSALDELHSKHLVDAMTIAVESATEEGEEQGPVLIDDIVDSYEIEAQPFLEKEGKNIEMLVEKIQQAADTEKSDVVLERLVDKLIQVVKNWDSVAQPIQVSTKSRGLDHDKSNHIAKIVRELAIHLFNEHDKLDLSQRLTSMLQEVFAEVAEVAERTAEDASALDEIAEQRVQLLEKAKTRAKEWEREITYEATIGGIFRNKLRISPEGIEWKGRRWKLDSITRVRWGGTRHSVNGIPTGTTYKIVFGNISDLASIELKQKDIYNNFIERLWKTVCVRILTEFLEGLKEGERYRFGSALIHDLGIELERKKLFSSNKREFCRWSELVIWNDSGVFCIGKKNDKKLATYFSYQDEDNIHILEAAIRMFWERGGDRISSLLED
ncbi:MAG: hypothetical protein B5M56_05570 [Desulfococcus sp. 4484_241]|nr:MAG: hypothetical protein B5M56_05570 [Desulfococcus sp. 4484_241]